MDKRSDVTKAVLSSVSCHPKVSKRRRIQMFFFNSIRSQIVPLNLKNHGAAPAI